MRDVGCGQYGSNADFHTQTVRVGNGGTQGRNLVGLNIVATVIDRPIETNDTNVAVTPGPEVVEDPRTNRALDESHGIGLFHIFLPGTFKDGHGGETATAHGRVGQLAGTPVRIYLIHVRSVDVDSPEHECGTHVSLVAKEHPLEQGTGRDDAGRRVRVHAQEFELRTNERRRLFRVGRRSRAAAVHVRCEVVDLLAVLFRYFRPARRTRVRAQDDTARKRQTDNRCTRLGGRRQVRRRRLCVCTTVGVIVLTAR